jgi:hypothetical protein
MALAHICIFFAHPNSFLFILVEFQGSNRERIRSDPIRIIIFESYRIREENHDRLRFIFVIGAFYFKVLIKFNIALV